MPPREYSRHSYSVGFFDRFTSNALFLRSRIPFRFQQRDDNEVVIAKEGDTLYTLAGRAFAPLERACGLWWVIADFQPEPIHDPTVRLAAGRALVVPSLRTVIEEVFDEQRIQESEV